MANTFLDCNSLVTSAPWSPIYKCTRQRYLSCARRFLSPILNLVGFTFVSMRLFEEDQDYAIKDETELPYEFLGMLGQGLTGNVEKVRDINTGVIYARKTIRISASGKHGTPKRVVNNEVAIIRSLKNHRHVVRVFATYVFRQEITLVLYPAADGGDLGGFLKRYLQAVHDECPPAEMHSSTTVLRQAFGCLANGLNFLHQQKIRHKDIKPGNILIHENQVLYTDFGSSLDSSPLGHSTTTGRPCEYTIKYAAPEVLDHEPRNSRSDVFSLGGVFIELFSALSHAVDIKFPRLSESITSIHTQIEDATPKIAQDLRFLVPVILSMTNSIPSKRCTAAQVSDRILVEPNFCCFLCRKAPVLSLASQKENSSRLVSPSRDYSCVKSELDVVKQEFDKLCREGSSDLENRPAEHPIDSTEEPEDWNFRCLKGLKPATPDLFDSMAALEVELQRLRTSDMQMLGEALNSPSLVYTKAQNRDRSNIELKSREMQLRIFDWLFNILEGSKIQQLLYLNIAQNYDGAVVGNRFQWPRAKLWWNDGHSSDLGRGSEQDRSSPTFGDYDSDAEDLGLTMEQPPSLTNCLGGWP